MNGTGLNSVNFEPDSQIRLSLVVGPIVHTSNNLLLVIVVSYATNYVPIQGQLILSHSYLHSELPATTDNQGVRFLFHKSYGHQEYALKNAQVSKKLLWKFYSNLDCTKQQDTSILNKIDELHEDNELGITSTQNENKKSLDC